MAKSILVLYFYTDTQNARQLFETMAAAERFGAVDML